MSEDCETIEILLVEDNPGDVRLTQEAFQEGRIDNCLTVCSDGEEAMALLRGRIVEGKQPPVLVLLDLNLPRKDGRTVLAEMKADPDLRRIPVIVLTSSAAERDIIESYEHNANAYVTKPIDLDDFIGAVRALEGFWLQVVRLPGQTQSGEAAGGR